MFSTFFRIVKSICTTISSAGKNEYNLSDQSLIVDTIEVDTTEVIFVQKKKRV